MVAAVPPSPPPIVFVIEKQHPTPKPKKKARPSQKQEGGAYFCVLVILVNVVAFVYSVYMNGWQLESMKKNPMFGPSAQTLRDVGAKDTYLIADCNEWWRLFSAQVLHGGIIHLLFNMLGLWDLGAGEIQDIDSIPSRTCVCRCSAY
jgi:membrane associated rhomboid family serine protease